MTNLATPLDADEVLAVFNDVVHVTSITHLVSPDRVGDVSLGAPLTAVG